MCSGVQQGPVFHSWLQGRKGDQNQVGLFTVVRPPEHVHPLPYVLVDVQQR